MNIEQAIGDRVRRRRVELGLSQHEVGKRLEPLLGKTWPRQAVWAAERGHRAFTAAELVALAQVLDVVVGWLITPEPGDIGLAFSTGAAVDIHDAVGVGRIAELRSRADALARFANEVRASLNALGT